MARNRLGNSFMRSGEGGGGIAAAVGKGGVV